MKMITYILLRADYVITALGKWNGVMDAKCILALVVMNTAHVRALN